MADLGTMLSDLDLLGITALTTADTTPLLNKAQREEIEAYPWSFLYSNLVINGNAGINTGTISVSQGSNQVNGVGTSFTSAMAGWFLWVGPTLTTPVIVSQVVSATQLLLGTPYGAGTFSNQQFTLQPLYYDVSPLIEVWRVRQIDLLDQVSQDFLNRIDPSRTSTGGNPSIKWAQAPFTRPMISGHVQIELWPRATTGLPYIVEGKLGAIDMVQPSDLPMVPSAVLEAKAMMYVCQTRTASDGDPRWAALGKQYQATYQYELDQARSADMRRARVLGINSLNSSRLRGIDLIYNHDYY